MKKVTTTMLVLMVSICIKAQSLKNKLDFKDSIIITKGVFDVKLR